jgi:HEAT repeat protein
MRLYKARLFARSCGLSWIVSMRPHPSYAALICRNQALFAVVDLGDNCKPILPALVSLAKTDSDPGVRASALEALRRLSAADYSQINSQTNALSTATQ